MTMAELTVLQIIGQFLAYSLFVVVLPGALFGRRLSRFSFPERLMIYQLIGNFYMMNVVFVLQLLHICNPLTLWGTTIVLSLFVWAKERQWKPMDALDTGLEYLRRLLSGTVGRKAVWQRAKDRRKSLLRSFWRWLRQYFPVHLPEWILFLAVFALSTNLEFPDACCYYSCC